LLWDSRTNASARTIVCEKYSIPSWAPNNEERIQERKVDIKNKMRAKNYAGKGTIIEAIIESRELCKMFC
jgi:hypothetical protein